MNDAAETDSPGTDEPRTTILPLPPDWLSAMDRIAGGLWAWTPLPRLADWLSVPCLAPDAAVIFALIEAGWLALWPLLDKDGKESGDMLVTFTAGAAERLRLEIIEEGIADRPRWGRIADTERFDDERTPGESVYLPNYGKLPTAEDGIVATKFNAIPRFPEVIDPSPGPVDVAIANEESAVAMRIDEVEVYDAEKDERRVERTESPLSLLGVNSVPVDPKIRGKRAKGKKGRRTG